MVFDIETVPDIDNGRGLFGLDGLSREDVGKAMAHLRQQKTGSEFQPLHLHRIVAISVTLRAGDSFRVWSLGKSDAPEEELVRRFFDGVERYSPDLVSWNGSGFDLPVLHYRSLLHGVSAPRYWEVGNEDRAFRYNNYLGRFHWRHLDLMDVLAGYQMRAAAPLDQVASMCGFPGKMGMSGAKVWDTWLEDDVQSIRDYCETDVLNTYLVYLRFELIRGHLDHAGYERECQLVKDTLQVSGKPHLEAFLSAWTDGTGESARETSAE
jgi:hypothetical protein